jgi:hypothetical protein
MVEKSWHPRDFELIFFHILHISIGDITVTQKEDIYKKLFLVLQHWWDMAGNLYDKMKFSLIFKFTLKH